MVYQLNVMKSNYNILLSHNGGSWPARLIKRASLSSGYVVSLYERQLDPRAFHTNPYVVQVVSPIDRVVEWCTFEKLNKCVEFYIGILACYV